MLIGERGLYVADAFRAFDADGDGMLSCTELTSGFMWLGLRVPAATVRELVHSLDTDGDGYVSLANWREAMGADDTNLIDAVDELPAIEQQPQVGADGDPRAKPVGVSSDEDAPLSSAERRRLRARLVPPRGFKEVWSSRGSGSASKASIWCPSLARPMGHANRQRLCLGHYGSAGARKPGTSATLMLELHDTCVVETIAPHHNPHSWLLPKPMLTLTAPLSQVCPRPPVVDAPRARYRAAHTSAGRIPSRVVTTVEQCATVLLAAAATIRRLRCARICMHHVSPAPRCRRSTMRAALVDARMRGVAHICLERQWSWW